MDCPAAGGSVRAGSVVTHAGGLCQPVSSGRRPDGAPRALARAQYPVASGPPARGKMPKNPFRLKHFYEFQQQAQKAVDRKTDRSQ